MTHQSKFAIIVGAADATLAAVCGMPGLTALLFGVAAYFACALLFLAESYGKFWKEDES